MRSVIGVVLLCAAAAAAEIRGFSVWDDLACRGETARDVPFAVPTLHSCASFCAADPDCGAFEYAVVDSYCSLKRSCASFASQPLTVTGITKRPRARPDVTVQPPPPAVADAFSPALFRLFREWLAARQTDRTPPPAPSPPRPFDMCAILPTESGQCTDEQEDRTQRLDSNEFRCREDRCWLDVTQLGALSGDGGADYARRNAEFLEGDNYPLFALAHATMNMTRVRMNYDSPDDADECTSTKADGSEGCPVGWVMCRGDCYMTIGRNSRTPDAEEDVNDSVELRCLACGGGRVALVNTEDPKMVGFALAMMREPGANTQRRAAVDAVGADGLWVRARPFNEEPFEHRNRQPWLAFTSIGDMETNGLEYCPGGVDGDVARTFLPPTDDRTYERILKDGSVDAVNQEAWPLCVTNPGLATELSEEVRLGCDSDPNHVWRCEYNYPCPGC